MDTTSAHQTCRGIIPPYLLARLADTDLAAAESATRTLRVDSARRQNRARYTTGQVSTTAAAERDAPTLDLAPQRLISDAQQSEQLPGVPVRSEGDEPSTDVAVNEAYDGLGATFALFAETYGRNSLDGKGLRLDATVHFGRGYDNAFWDGERMVFGDGDGEIFHRFTKSLDVIGHELAHGVTEHTAGLMYRGQPGALNESVSDVFGVLVKQRLLGQSAAQADWLVGADLLTQTVQGDALRSMIAPGTAYDDPRLGRDPQPDHMSRFVHTTEDNGGVHINSGIPNRAFVVAAQQIGGPAWERAGQLWYDVLTGPGINADCDFAAFAQLTLDAAAARFGQRSPEFEAVRAGWRTVGVLGAGSGGGRPRQAPAEPTPGSPADGIPADAEVHVRRTGGFAGLTRQGTVRLDEVPTPLARQWTALLTDPAVRQTGTAPASRVADGFVYHLTCVAFRVDTTLAQEQTSSEQRRLLDGSLE